MQIKICLRGRLLGALSGVLLLLHQILEFFLIQCLLLFLFLNGLLNGVLVSEHFLVQLLLDIICVLRIEVPFLPHYLQSSVHVSELKMSTSVWTNIPVLVDSGTQYYSLVEKIGDLLVFHFVI